MKKKAIFITAIHRIYTGCFPGTVCRLNQLQNLQQPDVKRLKKEATTERDGVLHGKLIFGLILKTANTPSSS